MKKIGNWLNAIGTIGVVIFLLLFCVGGFYFASRGNEVLIVVGFVGFILFSVVACAGSYMKSKNNNIKDENSNGENNL